MRDSINSSKDSYAVPRGRGLKVENEYVDALGTFYEKAPKAVLAAIAYSLANRLFGDGNEFAGLTEEWEALYAAKIVPQKPLPLARGKLSIGPGLDLTNDR